MRAAGMPTVATVAAAAALLAGCSGLANADDPVVPPEPGAAQPGTWDGTEAGPTTRPEQATGQGATAGPGPATEPPSTEEPSPSAEPSTPSEPAPTSGTGPTAGTDPTPGTDPTADLPPDGGSPLPDDYPWQPRQAPPPPVDGDDGGEPWVGGLDTVNLPETLEVLHDGEPTYSVTGIEIYEEGPDQSRVVVSYTGGEGRAGLDLSVAGVTDFPPEVTPPGGVDTGLAFLTGAHGRLGGGLEPGELVRSAGPSRVHGVSVGPPDRTTGTGIYVGLDAEAVLWAVVDHPGTLVLIVTDPGTGPAAQQPE